MTPAPLSVTIRAVRTLLEGGPIYLWLWQSAQWLADILLVFVIVAVRQCRSITS